MFSLPSFFVIFNFLFKKLKELEKKKIPKNIFSAINAFIL
jgi:hypothetical protein